MSYQLLAECIRSGQMDAREVHEALRDEVFARWFAKNGNNA